MSVHASIKHRRSDYTARRFRLAQTLKPYFILVDTPERGVTEIRDISDLHCSVVGQVDLNQFTIRLDWDRWIEPFDDEAIYQRLVDSARGNLLDEWVERGWEQPEVEVYDDDAYIINGFAIRGVFRANALHRLHEELQWALAPRAERFDQYEVLEAGQ